MKPLAVIFLIKFNQLIFKYLALDSESEHLVQEAIQKNLHGRTVILIAHRLSTVENADKIVVIAGGKVVQEGVHKDLLNQDGLYKQLVKRQMLSIKNLSKNFIFTLNF